MKDNYLTNYASMFYASFRLTNVTAISANTIANVIWKSDLASAAKNQLG